ncbi:MAG: hypothetical protein J6B57_03510 [Oscillospiraceae bacterium]|nr:hypothetical protein [Oscillospiraceae bacterium]
MLKKLLNRPTGYETRAISFRREYAELTDRLETIRTNFDNVSDESVIDALIYEENAVLCRLSALYRKARESGIRLEFPDEFSIK